MPIKCARCGVQARLVIMGRGQFSYTAPEPLSSYCPVLADELKLKGTLENPACPHLAQAAGESFDKLQSGRRS